MTGAARLKLIPGPFLLTARSKEKGDRAGYEIAVVPFPFAPNSKPRPALVLSMGSFNRRNGHTLLAMITTAGRPRWPSDYPIRDLRPTGLRTACVVRWKLCTLDNRALDRRIGKLGKPDTQGCCAALAGILDHRQDH